MITTILTFLVVLVVLVLVHEAGHAVVGKLTGCGIEEFGIGFPPRLLGKRIGRTLFTLNAIPLGGFVRITGEDGDNQDSPYAFSKRPFFARLAVLLAGVCMNLVLAWILFSIIVGVGTDVPVQGVSGHVPLINERIAIVDVTNSALTAAGIKTGETLLTINGIPVATADDAVEHIHAFSGTDLRIGVRSETGDNEEHIVHFPTLHAANTPIGIGLLDVATYHTSWGNAPLEGLRRTSTTLFLTAHGIGDLLRNGIVRHELPKDVAGPVGIASLVGSARREGILPLLELTAILSVNLALINVLPIPALDGGRVLFLLIEGIGIRRLRGRPEQLAHTIGFMVLLILIVLVTVGDVRRLFHL